MPTMDRYLRCLDLHGLVQYLYILDNTGLEVITKKEKYEFLENVQRERHPGMFYCDRAWPLYEFENSLMEGIF